MKKNKKTTKAAQKPAERPKLTDARVKARGKEGGGKTEGAREAQGEAGVRCSALLGDGWIMEEVVKNGSAKVEVTKLIIYPSSPDGEVLSIIHDVRLLPKKD